METELVSVVKRAADFHGHLGPFLVIGVRMGLLGLRALGVQRDEQKLRVTAMLKYSVPFSCVLDGIQVATSCTFGNQRLKLEDSSGIMAKFELEDGKEGVTVRVNPSTFDKLRQELLDEDLIEEQVERLAEGMASMPEEELFIKERG